MFIINSLQVEELDKYGRVISMSKTIYSKDKRPISKTEDMLFNKVIEDIHEKFYYSGKNNNGHIVTIRTNKGKYVQRYS